MNSKIISMGTMYVDINALQFPYSSGLLPNTEVVGSDYEVAPGGSALNFARICAALDLEPVFIGKSGQDTMGTLLSDLVSKSGVTPAFIQSADVSTNIGMNFMGTDGTSILTVVGSANQSLQSSEVVEKINQFEGEIDYLYLGGCFKLKAILPFYDLIVKKAHERKVKVILDHGRVTAAVTPEEKEIVRQLLPLVDIYLPSKDEFLELFGVSSIEDGISAVRKISSTIIIVKDAEHGAVGWDGKEVVSVPAFPVQVTNSIGAGDTFNAGFIKALSLELSFEESIRFGCAAAAIKISEGVLPKVEQTKELLTKG